METSQADNRPSFALGIALILVAAFFLIFAKDVPRTGLAGNTDPGPRALPVAMALVVASGGIIELLRAVVARRRLGDAAQATVAKASLAKTSDNANVSYLNFVILAAAMFVYLRALSWLGFQISTVLFSTGILMWLGARWWSALLSSLAIVIVVRILFVGLFHVQLPDGVWRLAI